MRSILDVRYTLVATVLNQYQDNSDGEAADTSVEGQMTGGHFETVQDEVTGATSRIFVEDSAVAPTRPGRTYVVDSNRFDVECDVRGFPEVGFRSSANTETFLDGRYMPIEFVRMNFPAKYVLNRRQFVTNIRNRNNQILWLEEETGQPTVFEVQGVTPTFDPFGRHVDNLAVLKRSDAQ